MIKLVKKIYVDKNTRRYIMGDFGDAERKILSFMVEGTEFEFEDRKYVVELSGKPTCHKGEPKTDIYVLAKYHIKKKMQIL